MSQLSFVGDEKKRCIDLRILLLVGGVAALIAGILFRRNIAAEIGIFSHTAPPATINGWFELLQSNRLLGLIYLNIFDLINYSLVGLMFLALYTALKHVNKSLMLIATVFGLVGITVYFASNTAFSMLSLSNQYMAAITDIQKNLLLAAGQAMLAVIRFGTGGYISLFFIAAAGMIISIVMLKSYIFRRITAYVGVLATSLDLVYCIALIFLPSVSSEILSVCFIPAAGLFLMIWHIMVGWRLWKLGRAKEQY